ncbi:hypothetical protein Leryth_012172 [Lithospermum erythrorhizon]|nr:hypothetical protein Leryth_012172 [Lithospermum erythrorhizon]
MQGSPGFDLTRVREGTLSCADGAGLLALQSASAPTSLVPSNQVPLPPTFVSRPQSCNQLIVHRTFQIGCRKEIQQPGLSFPSLSKEGIGIEVSTGGRIQESYIKLVTLRLHPHARAHLLLIEGLTLPFSSICSDESDSVSSFLENELTPILSTPRSPLCAELALNLSSSGCAWYSTGNSLSLTTEDFLPVLPCFLFMFHSSYSSGGSAVTESPCALPTENGSLMAVGST